MVLANHQRIVVGVDGSSQSLSAARWAAKMAEGLASTLHIVCALYTPAASEVVLRSELVRMQREEAGRIVDQTVAEMSQEYPELPITTAVEQSDPARMLIDAAKTARMLVVGGAGVGLIASALLGSTTRRVIDEAACPVVVWRQKQGADAPGMVVPDRPVVVGVDGSVASGEAVGEAFEIAASIGAPLLAVHSWNPAARSGDFVDSSLIDWAAAEVEEAAVLSESVAGWTGKYPDLVVRHSVRQGHPARTLVDISDIAELVVVGSRGRGPLTSAIMGSTSSNLAYHASCPVMICRMNPINATQATEVEAGH